MADTSQTFERGLQVLEAIDGAEVPLGVRELGRQLELGPAIVQRLINTLEQRGYVEQVADSRRYRIGYQAVVLGQSSRHGDSLSKLAHRELQGLAEEHGLNGYLGALRGDRGVYLLSVPSRHRVVLRIDAGETFALHATALGKVLLASAGNERARKLLGKGPLQRVTEYTIVDPSKILRLIPAIRKSGYAIVREENLHGIVSVGAPVRNSRGEVVAGISVAFAIGTTQLTEDVVVALVVESAKKISRGLGCPELLLGNWSGHEFAA